MKFYQTIKQLPEVRGVSDKEINRIWREYHTSKVSSTVVLTLLCIPLLGALGVVVEGLLGFRFGMGGFLGALIGCEIFTHARVSDVQSRIRAGQIQLNC
jgi:hypothetical protein